MDKKSILVFGVGPLQKSLIERCKLKGLFTVGIDPMEDALCKNDVDVFEVVDGQDFEKTTEVAQQYNIRGVITAATDKPLVMMARVAKHLNLPFFSIETAEWSTDKLFMKQKFIEVDIPCAKGFLLNNVSELESVKINYPVIVKPRDNSGSRGVIYCRDLNEITQAVREAFQYTKKESVLIEEFIEGKEYSVEAIHYKGESHVIQITEKITSDFPYNVELGHMQPADLSADQQNEIRLLVRKTAEVLKFENCASHTEIKINQNGIFVIETSPRLGGGFITSTLVPLSLGVNMEDSLIDIAIGNVFQKRSLLPTINSNSGIIFFKLPSGIITSIIDLNLLNKLHNIYEWEFSLKVGDKVRAMQNGIDRYGYAIFQAQSRRELKEYFKECEIILNKQVLLKL